MSLRGKLALISFMGLALDAGVLAQSQTTGRIVGSVKDMQSRAIPRAEIFGVAAATGKLQSAVSDESGEFVLLSLAPDEYDLRVTAPGFAITMYNGVIVSAGSTMIENVTLQVAPGTTEVRVTDSPPGLQVDSAAIESFFNTTAMEGTPLASRNSLQMLLLSPGISAALTNNSSLGRNSPEVSVNGARVNQNSYQVNGVDSNNISMHDLRDVAVPAPETVKEMALQTSLYDASVPGAGGSSVGLITKDGTNAVHGSLYAYFANKALDANDPNLKAVGLPRPDLTRGVYGATLGGPIQNDRVFYFVSYQGMHEINGATEQSLYSHVLIDPCLTSDRSAATLMKNCSVSTIDQASFALLNTKLSNGQFLIPTPQAQGLVTGTADSQFAEQQFNSNLDYRLGAQDLLAAKFFFANAPQFSALGWSSFGASPSFPGFGTNLKVNNRIFSIQESHTFGPRTVNELRFGYNWIFRNEQPNEAVQDTAIGISRITAEQFPGLPLIFLARDSGGAAIGTNEITLRNSSPSLSVFDSVSLQRGRHFMRFGGDIRHSHWRIDSANALSYGEIDFASFQDFLTGNSEFSLLGTGNNQVNYITTDYHLFAQDDWRISSSLTVNLGLRYELDLPPYESEGRIGGFDPTLYEPPTQVDSNGFPLGPPAQGIVMAGNAAAQIQLPGVTRVGKRIFKTVDPHDFGPRIGIAWSPLPSSRFAMRGGYGIFYSRPSFFYLGLNFAEPPFYQVSTFFGEPLAHPFPNAPPSNSFPFVPTGVLLSSPFAFVDRDNLNPYFQQFNTSVQYEISRGLALQIAYVGSRGLRLYRQVDSNQAAIASTDHPITNVVTGEVITVNTLENAVLRAPLQGVDPGVFSLNTSSGQSTYHSLQVSLNRRMTHGLQFSASYTFSKSIDNTSAAGGGAFTDGTLDTGNGLDSAAVYGNQLDPRANRGLSDFDRTHRLVASGVWELPIPVFLNDSNKWRGWFSDWQLSGACIVMSGLPIDMFDPSGGTLYGQLFGARPSWAPGATIKTATRNIPSGYYFNPYAFKQAIVQAGQAIPSAKDPTALAGDIGTDYGNVGRNILRGPGQSNVDVSVRKRIALRESRYLEVRSDFFNVFNHSSQSNPVSSIGSASIDGTTGQIMAPGNFGRILGTNSSPRMVQISVHFNF